MEVQNVPPGRPRKFEEDLEALNCKVPKSLRAYVDSKKPISPTDVTIAALTLDRDISEGLAEELADLRISAAQDGQSYDMDRAETIVRLVKLGLMAEKKIRR